MRTGTSLFAVLLLIALATSVGAAAPDDTGASAACQQGYRTLAGLSADHVIYTFNDLNDCTTFAAHGGRLVPLSPAVLACANGGFATYLDTDRTPFASEARCVAYVGDGGTLHPGKAALAVTATLGPDGYALALTGSGLSPGSPLTLRFSLVGYGVVSLPVGIADPDEAFSRRYTNMKCATFSDILLAGPDFVGDLATSGTPYTAC